MLGFFGEGRQREIHTNTHKDKESCKHRHREIEKKHRLSEKNNSERFNVYVLQIASIRKMRRKLTIHCLFLHVYYSS